MIYYDYIKYEGEYNMKKFNFIDLDKSKLPVTKGKKVDGFRFYDIDGKPIPSVTSVLGIKRKTRTTNYKVGVRRLVKMLFQLGNG